VQATLAALLVGAVAANAVPVAGAKSSYKVPQLGHVFTIVLENKTYEQVTSAEGQAAMPYLTGLTAQGVTLDQMYATGHLSLGNYIAMTSGYKTNEKTRADCFFYDCVYKDSKSRNIGDQLEGKGLTWKGYMEDMPMPCAHGTPGQLDPYLGGGSSGGYATRHNPFVYYGGIVHDQTRCNAHDVPYTDFATDLGANTVPNYSFIVPNTCNDAHNEGDTCGLDTADTWLSNNVPQILSSPAYADRGVLIITFDESNAGDQRGCCKTSKGGRIFTLVLSPLSTHAGTHSSMPYSQYSMLRTIEDGFGLKCLRTACKTQNQPFGPEVLT
jgi:hypothetical protein